MTFFIFAGDLLVMLFMICLVVWFSLFEEEEKTAEIARIPLEDEDYHG